MKQYLDLAQRILSTGKQKTDRTGTGTISIHGPQMRFDLREGFPLLTTKKMGLKNILVELLFFLRGETNNKWLNDRGCTIWDEWALKSDDPELDGELGPVYGAQWRFWEHTKVIKSSELEAHVAEGYKIIGGMEDRLRVAVTRKIDQFAGLEEKLAVFTNSRRLIVTGWNPAVLPDEGASHETNVLNGKQVLPPCHGVPFQLLTEPMSLEEVYTENKLSPSQVQAIEYMLEEHEHVEDPLALIRYFAQGIGLKVKTHYLDLSLVMRSMDVPLGCPYNIASYALLLSLLAHKHGYQERELILTAGDAHVYLNQIPKLQEQLEREPYALPKLVLNPNITDFVNYDPLTADEELFRLVDYKSHPRIIYPDPAV